MLFQLHFSLATCALSLIVVSATPASVDTRRTYHHTEPLDVTYGRMLRRTTTEQLFSESIDKLWEGQVLFALSQDIESSNGSQSLETELTAQVACRTCYVTGTISGSYTRDASIDATVVEESVQDILDNFWDASEEAVLDFLSDDSVHYTNVDFSVDLGNLTYLDYKLQIQFDDLELYMALDTSFSAQSTYTLNLFKSQSPVGVSLSAGDVGAELGAFFTVDLILRAEGEVDVSSGVHIKIDSASINIGLFDDGPKAVTMDGGAFEFLPVSVVGSSFSLTGSLRVGINAGVGIDVDVDIMDVSGSAGAAMGLYANIAEFSATGTADSSNQDCDLALIEAFTMALGAQAGATVAVNLPGSRMDHTWGPTPETETPIWYTEIATACATLRSPLPSSPAAVRRARQVAGDASVVTTTTETTYPIVSCKKTGVINCPVSDQTTMTFSTTLTMTTTESDASVTAQASISRIPFGSNKQDLTSTSGKLVSYSPPPASSTSTGGGGIVPELVNEVAHNKPLIIGLSVGLGVPVIAIIIGATLCCTRRRKRSTKKSKPEIGPEVVEFWSSSSGSTPGQETFIKKVPTVVVVEGVPDSVSVGRE